MKRAGDGRALSAEAEVAKQLQTWWREREPDCVFAKASETLRPGFRPKGNVVTTARRFPFAVVVRNQPGWTVERLSSGEPCTVWEWWAQALDEALELGIEPMLWFTMNGEPWRVLVREVFLPRGSEVFGRWRVDQLDFCPESEWPVCLDGSVLSTAPSDWI